jgi:succinate-semialdehyde dehydrogenase/glutarate-semialdehyde dehydrogenase
MSSHSMPKLSDRSLFITKGFIDGKFVDAKSGKTYEVMDPASGKVIGTMPEMDKSDMQTAIDAALAALPSFRKTTPQERSRMLHQWYQLMMDNAEDLAKLITWENGKPFTDSRAEVKYAADYFEWFAGEAPRIYGNTIAASVPDHRVYTIKEPVGVVGLITPWNWPAGMVTRKLG